MIRPALRDRVEDALLAAMQAGVGALPGGAPARVGEWLGTLVGPVLGIRRATVSENLRRAFPERDDAWRESLARAAYRHLGREAVEMVRLARLRPEEVVQRTVIAPEDWERFEAARALGRGVLLVTGHFGNWEVAAAALAARGVPIGAVVKRMRNPLVDRRLEDARARLGVETIDVRDAPRRIPRLLASGGVVGIVADQDARAAGVFVPFFGVPASTYRGPALFALRLDAPVFAAVARRLPDGRYRIAGEPVHIAPSGDLERDVHALTAALARQLEAEVRRDPAQYFWFHRRWKTAPPAEPTAAGAGTTVEHQRDVSPSSLPSQRR